MRSLLILVLVLAGLGAYIYFVESKRPGSDAPETRPKVFSVSADKIAELTVKVAGGERTALRKSDGGWQIVEPTSARADDTEVSTITTNLATVENARVVDENPSDLKQYGLAEPRIDVGFKSSDAKSEHHLLIGDKTATGGEVYAKTGGDKKVFLISAYLDSTFSRSSFDLRDKAILRFERDKVEQVEIAGKEQAVRLTRSESEWVLAQPIQAPADYGTVEGLVGRLQSAQMKAIAAPEAAELAQYGLDEPELTASVGAGSTRATLLIGKKTDAGTMYAKDASRPLVFTVEATLLDDLRKTVDELRRKDLFAFRSYNATAVDFTRGTETISFERVKGKDKDASETWRQTKPAARQADASAVDTMLTKFANLRAQSWVDGKTKTGLDAPVLVVAVRFEDGKKNEKVVFGKVASDVYASVAAQPGAAKLAATEYDEAVKALDALK